MEWQYTPYTLPLISVGIVTAVLAFYVFWRYRGKTEAWTVTVLMVAVAGWSLTYAMELASADFAVEAFWAKFEYLWIVTVPSTWLVLSLQYAKREKWITLRNLACLAIEPIITIVLVWTNDFHYLIWSRVDQETSGLFSVRALTYGHVFWFHSVYSHLLFAVGTFLIFKTFIGSQHLRRKQAGIMLAAGLAPWVGNAIYISGLSPNHLDLTPLAFGITCLACFWGLFRFRLIDILPVARDTIIEGMNDAVIVLDARNRVVDINLAGQRLVNEDPSRVIGQPLEQVWPYWSDKLDLISDTKGVAREIHFAEGDSRDIYDMRVFPLFDWRGELISNVVILRDITERKRTEEELHKYRDHLEEKVQERTAELTEVNLRLQEEIAERKQIEGALRESEERYRSLFEDSKDVVFICTPEGNLVDINPAGVELLGYSSRKDLLKVNLIQELLFDSNDREKYEKAIVEQGFVRDYEIALKDKNGKQVIATVTANIVRDKDGNIAAYRGIMRDITEKKQLEQQLLQAQKMESIGTLAGGIAHDFNNLLAGILGYASLMKTKISQEDTAFSYIDTIEKSAARAAELTAQLLAFARGGKYESRPVNLNNIVKETLNIIARTFEKSIEIKTRFSESLPTVEADAAQLEQVIMNLSVNARDAMLDGGKLIIETNVASLTKDYTNVHVGAKPGLYVCLTVSDTGVGMDKDTVRRVFEPFFTTKEKGTGLGLAMVYGVVKNHGGHVCVYSEPGEGSTFKVYLPANGKPEVKDSPQYEMPVSGNELILVVDDEESIRSLARDMLESYGYKVLSAENGPTAIRVLKENKGCIDLIILDMVMPTMGGHEAFLKFKEIDPSVKVLLSTGYSQDGKAREILDSGVKGFLQKPYQVNTLLTKIRGVLDEKQQPEVTRTT